MEVVLFCILIALLAHALRLGTPYIEMRYFCGQPHYYVWIRRFLGYNDLAGSFDKEADARALVDHIKRNPPKTMPR